MNIFKKTALYCHKWNVTAIGTLLLLVLLMPCVFHPLVDVHAGFMGQRIYDNGELLTSEEAESLETTALELGEKHNTDIYILTDEDSDGKSRKKYMEDFADEKEVTNATILFVNMEPGNRGVELQNYGNNEDMITDSRIEYILGEVTPYLSEGDFYQAFQTFLREADYYLDTDPKEDTSIHAPNDDYTSSDKYYEDENSVDSPATEILIQLIISLIIGGIAVGIMAYHSGGRVTVNERTYLDASHSKVLARRDDYIRTTTTKRRKPVNNNHSTSGGSGVSSGGRSHNGGGRSF